MGVRLTRKEHPVKGGLHHIRARQPEWRCKLPGCKLLEWHLLRTQGSDFHESLRCIAINGVHLVPTGDPGLEEAF